MALFKSLEISFRKLFIRSLKLFTSRSGNKDIPDKAKVLLLRQDRIGDLLVSTAVIHALAECKPSWQLDMLFGRSNINILEHDPLIKKRWYYNKSIFGTIKLIRQMRKEKYDLVIDLMDNTSATSTALLAFAGGKVNAGLEKENSFAYDITAPLRSKKETHVVQRLADILRVLDCDVKDSELQLSYTPSDSSSKRAKKFFSKYKASGKKICCVNISARAENRLWGEDNYKAFISEAVKLFPDILFFAAAQPDDIEHAENICKGIERAYVIPASQSFDEFAAMVNEADVVVTPDTSVVHLSSALNKPTLALFPDEYTAKNWSPYGVPYWTVVAKDNYIKSIPVNDVIEAFKSLVK